MYEAPRILRNPHLSTIFAARVARRPPLPYRRERWETPDGDFIDLDFVEGEPTAPRVVLFHGLEGSSRSGYAQALMAQVQHRRWRGVVPHFRGCSGELNRKPRAYHSGDSPEVDWILRRLLLDQGEAPLYVAGVSLGGNMLLKWLGEQGSAASFVRRAASICAPVDLHAAGAALERGFARVYTWDFLRRMKATSEQRILRFPGLFDVEAMRRARTIRAFDDVVTAPLHGFSGVDDYWTRASSKPHLQTIAVPTLLLNALDDPFLPAEALPAPSELSQVVTAEYPRHGGHVGFVGPHGDLNWLPTRLLSFFDESD